MIHPEWKMIDHINRSGLDKHECNLNKTTPRENALNCKLFKTNTSGYNGISFIRYNNTWRFRCHENNKCKSKDFYITKKRTSEQAKQQCIKFKLKHDKIVGNLNGYNVEYV
ncbi:hypothetical protein C2G38_2221932 [Gigaspora rosea]|uniref:AP2/ERF domain-containing protein n=1 Tax=Gigaspora rosea TaxID=44941 RepID=A0A397U4P7_9GLOM|nr:hypothetical protein C2G38_2221932 [Gigaspora rosea]